MRTAVMNRTTTIPLSIPHRIAIPDQIFAMIPVHFDHFVLIWLHFHYLQIWQHGTMYIGTYLLFILSRVALLA